MPGSIYSKAKNKKNNLWYQKSEYGNLKKDNIKAEQFLVFIYIYLYM